MKKKMIILLAAALLALGASNAMAYFDDFNLVRVVYNSVTGNETATDLGNITTLLGQVGTSGSVKVGGGADAFTSGTGLGASADANLHVAYLVANTGTGPTATLSNQYNLWFSATGATPSNPSAFAQVQTAMINTFYIDYGNVGAYDRPSTVSTTSADTTAYQNTLAYGSFGNFLSLANGEASLATLASGSVQQGLYYWADAHSGGATASGSAVQVNGADLAILTNADGSTTLQTATPIPAAIYLMGSGLLGMFGLRRKQRG